MGSSGIATWVCNNISCWSIVSGILNFIISSFLVLWRIEHFQTLFGEFFVCESSDFFFLNWSLFYTDYFSTVYYEVVLGSLAFYFPDSWKCFRFFFHFLIWNSPTVSHWITRIFWIYRRDWLELHCKELYYIRERRNRLMEDSHLSDSPAISIWEQQIWSKRSLELKKDFLFTSMG